MLDSNGVWYSWFWPEGSINTQNSTFLGFHFVPGDLDSSPGPLITRDLDSRRRGPGLAEQGPRLAAPWDLDSNLWRRESRSLLRESRSPAPWVQVPCYQGTWTRVQVPGDKMKTQKCWVLGVYRPLRPKSAIPHPITIQNMRFER